MKKEASISLDLMMTGKVLEHMIKKQGYTVSGIQKELKLSCPQPIYRWINGQTMPSIDNLYRLSTILKVHMEELVVPRQDEAWIIHGMHNPDWIRRLKKYHKKYHRICHGKDHGSKKAGR